MPRKSLKVQTLETLLHDADPNIRLKAAQSLDRIDARRERRKRPSTAPTPQERDRQAVYELEN
jgi:hypothetical protein